MKTSIDRVRAKIAELEAKIADLRIAERELNALETAPVTRTKSKTTTNGAATARHTVGAAITEVLSENGPLPLAEIAEQIRTAGREVSGGTLSNTLQVMKKRGAVKSGNGKWMLRKTRAKRAGA
ncbi:MAG TPA: hypothetical protein VLZ74_05685 [Methylocella sp.]|nr:hypothetical protein [Methylocella sp.]